MAPLITVARPVYSLVGSDHTLSSVVAGAPLNAVITWRWTFAESQNGTNFPYANQTNSSLVLIPLVASVKYWRALATVNGTEYMSNPIIIHTLEPPTNTQTTPGDTYVTVSWDAVSNASMYRVDYKLSTASTWQSVTTPYTTRNIYGLTNGLTYLFRVATISGVLPSGETADTYVYLESGFSNSGVPSMPESPNTSSTTYTLRGEQIDFGTNFINLQLYTSANTYPLGTFTLTRVNDSVVVYTSVADDSAYSLNGGTLAFTDLTPTTSTFRLVFTPSNLSAYPVLTLPGLTLSTDMLGEPAFTVQTNHSVVPTTATTHSAKVVMRSSGASFPSTVSLANSKSQSNDVNASGPFVPVVFNPVPYYNNVTGIISFSGISANTNYEVTIIGTAGTEPVELTYSFTTAPAGDGGGGGGGAVCFLADAPVLTPAGYKPISFIKEGDLVRTAAGRDVAVKRVFVKEYQAGASVNPFVIPKGSFGALRALPISPNHEVMTVKGMVQAKELGLRRMKMAGSFTYYNLELEDWVRDNLVVAGVECESLAPAARVTMTKAEFTQFVHTRYGPAAAARLKSACYLKEDGRVSMPAL